VQERVNIALEREKIIRGLRELEKEFNEDKISKKEYNSRKKEYTEQLETIEVADRIKRLQGKGTVEKPLEHWVNKSKIEKDKVEKEELFKEYLTPSAYKEKTIEPEPKGKSRLTVLLAIFVALAFFVGTGFGVYIFNMPSQAPTVPLIINESAFPTSNGANLTQNLTRSVTTTTTPTTTTTTTPTPTTTTTTPTPTTTNTKTTKTNTKTITPTTT
jgi:hypothetical protein